MKVKKKATKSAQFSSFFCLLNNSGGSLIHFQNDNETKKNEIKKTICMTVVENAENRSFENPKKVVFGDRLFLLHVYFILCVYVSFNKIEKTKSK